MGILLKPFILDVIILFYVMIMLILGYKKGFIVRLYDFLSQKIGIPSISPVSDARKIISMSMAIERASTKLLLYKKNYNDSFF